MTTFNALSFSQAPKRALDPYAIHNNRNGEVNAVGEKTTPADSDLLLIEDSSDEYSKKKLRIGDLSVGANDTTALHVDTGGEILDITLKPTPVGGDLLVIEDSQASFSKKRVDVATLPSPIHTHPIGEVDDLANQLNGKKNDFVENSGFNLDIGTTPGTVSAGDHTHPYEPAFTKNTGFNLPLGAVPGSVAAGDHNHAAQGWMLESVYDPTASGVVIAAENAQDVGPATPGNNLSWGTDGAGVKGYFPSGEINTTTSLGAGEPLALPKVGVDFPFKTMTAGDGIVLTGSPTELEVSSAIRLFDTGSNLFPYFVDTYRGNKNLSVETVHTNFFRNTTTFGSTLEMFAESNGDANLGWVPHINCTIVAVGLQIEGSTLFSEPMDLVIRNAINGADIAVFAGFGTTDAAGGRVVISPVDMNFDIAAGTSVTFGLVSGAGGTVADPKVTMYTRWNF